MFIDNDLGIDLSTLKVVACVKHHHIRPPSGSTKRDSMIFYKHLTPSGSLNRDKKSLKSCGYTVGQRGIRDAYAPGRVVTSPNLMNPIIL